MQDIAYETESQIEQTHWWFVARRKLFSNYIEKMNLDKEKSCILDIGSSSGTNMRMLKNMGFKNYKGFDYNIISKNFCEEKELGEVIIGDICSSNLESNQFDLILATDLIEHIKDDDSALKEIYRILKPNGHLVVTVPCFMMLWGSHDEVSMHQRRYLLKNIIKKMKNVEFQIQKSYYFNFILFLPIFLFRKIIKLLKIDIKSENSVNTSFLNKILLKVFVFDMFLAKLIKPPFGVSAFILATK